jgi:DNA-directed RNA polymerase subunit RPC12/RpoP
VDDDGYLGRECPECGRLFKMDAAKYEALPDDLELICPYCDERQDHGAFAPLRHSPGQCEALTAVTASYRSWPGQFRLAGPPTATVA